MLFAILATIWNFSKLLEAVFFCMDLYIKNSFFAKCHIGPIARRPSICRYIYLKFVYRYSDDKNCAQTSYECILKIYQYIKTIILCIMSPHLKKSIFTDKNSYYYLELDCYTQSWYIFIKNIFFIQLSIYFLMWFLKNCGLHHNKVV